MEIDQDGVVTALKEGVATITLSASGSNISATLRVNVKSPFVIDDARTLVAYKGFGDENGVVEIPDDEGILYIGPYAFTLFTYDDDVILDDDDYYANRIPYGNDKIKKVIIPQGVMEVQRHAFYNCTSLEEVVLPSSIKFIREYAFYKCESLKKINLYENNGSKDDNVWVEAIGAFAFSECAKLESIDLSHVYSIGEDAFSYTALKEVNLTALRNTGMYAFADCLDLKKVIMDPNGNTKLSESMFWGSGLTSVDIYEKKSIPAYCFAGCEDLVTVTMHNSLLAIEEGAFFDCIKLKVLTLPDSSVKIGAISFADCFALETLKFQAHSNIEITNSIQYDEDGYAIFELGTAFSGSAIKEFKVDPANKYYSASKDGKLLLNEAGDTVILAATGAKFGDYTLPEEIAYISTGAFSGTDISTLTILNDDLKIGSFAFAECLYLVTVNFPETVGDLEIGAYAFYTVFTESVSILTTLNNLDKVMTVGDYAFARTAVKEVTTGAGAVYGEGVFLECAMLEKVTVGANSSFGYGAFQDCWVLAEVVMPEDGDVSFGPACFKYNDLLSVIDLSKLKKIEYQTFFGCISLESVNLASVEVIEEYAFAYCKSLSQVSMPKVVSIGDYAFSGDVISLLERLFESTGNSMPVSGAWTMAPVFEAVVLPETLEYLGEGAFAACWNLKEITIPSKITEIKDYTFAFCIGSADGLQKVVLPDSVDRIGESAFLACYALTSINLGKVEVIDANAFMYDYQLEEIDLGNATIVGYGAFANCEGITGKIVANKLEAIGDLAFADTGITEFEAAKLAYIGAGAFNYTGLKEFVFSTDIEFVGSYAFAESMDLESFYFGPDKSKSGKINDYALLADGVLYIALPNGSLQLSSVPAGMRIDVLEVIEGTVRIDLYAGGGNHYIEKIVLPDTLQVIGNYAFYDYVALKTVEFKSVVAPVFENYYSKEELDEDAPGYNLLHNQYGLFGWELSYYNIIGLLGDLEPINMILPANSDISGYDSIVYEAYFGKVADAQRSDYVAMQTNMRSFVDYAIQIMEIGKINLNHENLIISAVTALNGITQNYADFGFSDEEWAEYTAAVTGARAKLLELKLENASKTARNVQERINNLPDTYNGEADVKEFYEQLRRDFNLLARSDKEALDITRYTAFRALFDAYEAEHSSGSDNPSNPNNPDNPSNPNNPDNPDNPSNPGSSDKKSVNVLAIVLPIVGGIVIVAAAVAVFVILRKRKGE